MINHDAAYTAAITGTSRRIRLRAVVDIIDPDLVYGMAQSSGESVVSKAEQLHNKEFDTVRYVTLEQNRWLLDGGMPLVPQDRIVQGEVGYVSDVLSGEDCTFDPAPWVELRFSNVDVLQALSIFFPENDIDGMPEDFTITVRQSGSAYYTKTVTGNTERKVSATGFTVYNPDAIRITVTKWSLPYHRMRIPEIIPGVYETWDGDTLAEFSIKQQGDVSCVALPYGTCDIRMDNLDRRFEPRNKAGLFSSIEDRQGIEVQIGVDVDGVTDWKPAGIYYQYSTGWKTGDNDITMAWSLVDIIGLVADRQYIPPQTLPTTLGGWLQSIVSQLGTNFTNRWSCDPAYAGLSCTATQDKIQGLRCGDIIRYVCMATGTWPRADSETGKLTAEPLWSQGNYLDLDNMNVYPVIAANDDLAAIIFTLDDDVQYVVSGNNAASDRTVSVQNPFIHNATQALSAARNILATVGGNQLQITGRGDPTSEIGDVDTVQLDESSATTGRRIYQTFDFKDGVMQGCASTLLQADGGYLFNTREVITQDGAWTAPAGVSQLRVIIGNGGGGGTDGTNGTWYDPGEQGVPGIGGKIWSGTININPQQSFSVHIGAGGNKGEAGGETTFGSYSGNNGAVFTPSYTDVSSGDAFGRSGVKAPSPNTSDGGKAGSAGKQGQRHEEERVDEETGEKYIITVVDSRPTNGTPGVKGASGFVVIYYSVEE